MESLEELASDFPRGVSSDLDSVFSVGESFFSDSTFALVFTAAVLFLGAAFLVADFFFAAAFRAVFFLGGAGEAPRFSSGCLVLLDWDFGSSVESLMK